jgi:hypothetical protein
MTYGVTLLHTKEAYLHRWFYDIWESLSSKPFFTFVAIVIMNFPVYILIGIDVTSWSYKYTFYSDSCYELDKNVHNISLSHLCLQTEFSQFVSFIKWLLT